MTLVKSAAKFILSLPYKTRFGIHTIHDVNPLVINSEYAVRGAVPLRAAQIAQELKKPNNKYNFTEILQCNIGNPQAFG